MGDVLVNCGLLEIVAMEMWLLGLPTRLPGVLVGTDRGRCSVVTKTYLVTRTAAATALVINYPSVACNIGFLLQVIIMSSSTEAQQSVFVSAQEERQWNRVGMFPMIAMYAILKVHWQLSEKMSDFHEWFKQEC